MTMHQPNRPAIRFWLGGGIALLACLLMAMPAPVDAQYFGRNKVQYDEFDFRILTTPHFEIHLYEGMEEAIDDVSRMSERWYERLARLFQHEFAVRKPLIFYADNPDFHQTNTISSHLGEGTGGVTESLKNRVIMPLSGSYASTDHVLGHELVHAFQYNLAQSRRGGGMQGLMRIPLWMIEGMAEYLALGREDPLTAMWLRDALLRDDFPTLTQMTRETRFFPYRFGQAFWTYIGGTYGDEAVATLFRSAIRIGWEPAIQQTLAISSDSLSAQWREAAEAHYRPLMEGRTSPAEAGTLLMAPSTGAGYQNVAPAISPDGRHMVVMSEKDLFSFDLYLVDARTGEIVRRLHSAATDPHMDAMRFIDSSGAWSPDGSSIVFVAFAGGRNELVIVDSDGGGVQRRLRLSEDIGEATSPSWSPDGRHIVFSGQIGGLTDLFFVDVETDEVTQLTHDRHADFQPTFSPDGEVIAFVTDRGAETDFDILTYSRPRIALYSLETGEIEVLDLFDDVRHSNPQYSPDGQSLYFLSDPDGFSDIYRVDLAAGSVFRVTEINTAVTGITAMSPAMSVARETGTVVFSVFDEFQFHVYSMDSRDAPDTPMTAEAIDPTGRFLPPAEPAVPSRVAAYLDDPRTALVPPGTYDSRVDADDYGSGLSLDYIGQPMVGVGVDQFGNYVSGAAAAYFSDMLGDKTLGVAVMAQGTVKDIGGQVVYQDMGSRWNWGVVGGRIPYLQPRTAAGRDPATGYVYLEQDLFRIFQTHAIGLASYPFSTTRRVDFTAGVNRYSFDLEREFLVFDSFGRLIDRYRESSSEGVPEPVNMFQSSVALVGDNSFFGFTSPIRGSRYRMEVGNTAGTLNFQTVTLDYRRYFNPISDFTFAIRGLHHGRYGDDVYGSILQPLFLGWETYIRGYSSYSFRPESECSPGSEALGPCPELERLFGQRVAVMNAELRFPLLGVERLGLINFNALPTELIAFTDMGLAWDSQNEAVLEFSRTSLERIPVISSGVGARMNVLGLLIVEAYYAIPWQRPARGAHWGFQLAPGW